MTSGLSSSNYSISFYDGTPTISNAFNTTTLVSSMNPSTYGQSVTFTATVTANAPSTINPASTGSITFKDGASTTLCSAPVAIDGYGKASCAVNYLAAGSHSVTATYSGDSNYTASPASATLSQATNPAPLTT